MEIKDLKYLLAKQLGTSNIEIISQSITDLTKPGDNYGSRMVKINIIILKNKIQQKFEYVGKLCPENEFIQNLFNIENTFKKEVLFYLKMIPTIAKFEHRYKSSTFQDIFPKCINARINLANDNYSDFDKKMAIILLENLNLSTYYSVNRLKGFNVIETEKIIKTMVKFHTNFISFRNHEFNTFKHEIESIITSLDANFNEFDPGFIEDILENVKVASYDFYILHKDRIKSSLEKSRQLSKLNSGQHSKQCLYMSIIHSDLWTNNIMIRNKGTTVDVKFLDFQLIKFDCALKDLIFFLLTSVNSTVLTEFFDSFLNLYFKSFIEYLSIFKIFNIDQYGFEDFQNEINKCVIMEFYHITKMLRFIFSSKKVAKDLNEFCAEDLTDKTYLGPEYYKKLINVINMYLERKWI